MLKRTLHIAFCAAQNKEIGYISVILSALLKHQKSGVLYDVRILCADTVSSELCQMLEALSKPEFQIRCIDVLQHIKIKDDKKVLLKKYTFLALLIPAFFSDETKVLYLNHRCLPLKDITPLFDVKLKGYAVAAVQNADSENILNAGVVLFNIPYWKKYQLAKKCMQLTYQQDNTFSLDAVLNKYCLKNMLSFKPAYNVLGHVFLDCVNQKQYPECISDIVILNYTHATPWLDTKQKLCHLWWQYARWSPFYEDMLTETLKRSLLKPVQQDICMYRLKEKLLHNPTDVKPLVKSFIYERILSLITYGQKARMHKQKAVQIFDQIRKKAAS